MLKEKLSRYKIILASNSLRRKFLLKELALDFEVRTKEIDESFPENLKAEKIAMHLARKKSESFKNELLPGELLITADTIVWIHGKVLNKPSDEKDAKQMLKTLSGKMHTVFTAVCLTTTQKQKTFFSVTKVYFKKLSAAEIKFYVKNFQPFDKAGAYGAQEWIGYIGIEKIIGSYFNVMGLPVKELYEELMKF